MPTLSDLFEIHGLVSYDKQVTLGALVEGRGTVSYRGGRLSFADDLSFGVQLLGSRSEYDNTWLWAWANPGLSGWPIEASRHLYEFGRTHDVPELTQSKFILDGIDGHYLTMVASGILGADCYYRFPYHEGAAFLAIPDAPEVRALSDLSAHYVASRITDFICQYECCHRVAVEHYLRYKGFALSGLGGELTAVSPRGQSLKARFDPGGRLLGTEAVVTGPIYPEGA